MLRRVSDPAVPGAAKIKKEKGLAYAHLPNTFRPTGGRALDLAAAWIPSLLVALLMATALFASLSFAAPSWPRTEMGRDTVLAGYGAGTLLLTIALKRSIFSGQLSRSLLVRVRGSLRYEETETLKAFIVTYLARLKEQVPDLNYIKIFVPRPQFPWEISLTGEPGIFGTVAISLADRHTEYVNVDLTFLFRAYAQGRSLVDFADLWRITGSVSLSNYHSNDPRFLSAHERIAFEPIYDQIDRLDRGLKHLIAVLVSNAH